MFGTFNCTFLIQNRGVGYSGYIGFFIYQDWLGFMHVEFGFLEGKFGFLEAKFRFVEVTFGFLEAKFGFMDAKFNSYRPS